MTHPLRDAPEGAGGGTGLRVGYLVFRPESLTFTVCRALSECGIGVSIWTADAEPGARLASSIQQRVQGIDGVRIVGRDAAQRPEVLDRLIVQCFPRTHDVLRELPPLAARARAITLISAGDRSRRWAEALRLQGLELRSLGAAARRVDRVLYKDGFHKVDLFAAGRRRDMVGFDVHSQFLSDRDKQTVMHARDWDPHVARPLRANFMGCRDPQPRLAILDAVRERFVSPSGTAIASPGGQPMFWCEYSDAAPQGLTPVEFVQTLTQSDFTLCPLGYSRVTHRPLEALLRGSIPVLDASELDLYGIELADGGNCIAVGRDGWAAAVDRIAAMPEPAVLAMRARVHAMRPALDYARLAAGICSRLGLQRPQVEVAGRSAAHPDDAASRHETTT
ncbi:MAG: hypothetical protein HYZ20_02820 [Burkholderiales bacterium]|nr:hypothetical protein [Burkholderiales bacterium]